MRRIAPDFGSDATQQADQRTSQMVYLFFAEAIKPVSLLKKSYCCDTAKQSILPHDNNFSNGV